MALINLVALCASTTLVHTQKVEKNLPKFGILQCYDEVHEQEIRQNFTHTLDPRYNVLQCNAVEVMDPDFSGSSQSSLARRKGCGGWR